MGPLILKADVQDEGSWLVHDGSPWCLNIFGKLTCHRHWEYATSFHFYWDVFLTYSSLCPMTSLPGTHRVQEFLLTQGGLFMCLLYKIEKNRSSEMSRGPQVMLLIITQMLFMSWCKPYISLKKAAYHSNPSMSFQHLMFFILKINWNWIALKCTEMNALLFNFESWICMVQDLNMLLEGSSSLDLSIEFYITSSIF